VLEYASLFSTTIRDGGRLILSLLWSLTVSSLILCGFTPPLPGGVQIWGWSLIPVLIWGAGLGRLSDPHREGAWSASVGFGYGIGVTLMILSQLLPNQHGSLLILKGTVVTFFSALPFTVGAIIVSSVVSGPKTDKQWRRGDFKRRDWIFGLLVGLTWNTIVYVRFRGGFTVRGFPWSNGWWTLVEGLWLAAGFHIAFFVSSRILNRNSD